MKLESGAHVTANVKLLRPLGEGGMGAVWVAEHLALNTEVAVKFLQGDYAKDPAARSRFSQEAAAASQVKSSHVVKIYDYGLTDSNVPFIVMELLEGTDVAKRIETEKALAPSEVVTIIAQLCKALAKAHEQNVVHRDVKPENVFLTQEGGELFVKLLDFGVAKTSTMRAVATGGVRHRSTMAGESLGTPYYMSPEQFKSSKTIDHRSDLWSVGVLAYETLTGSLPFVADTVGALAIVVNDAVALPPSRVNPALPSSFDAWFAKACARDPADRFQSARELADALTLTFGTMPTAPRPIDTGAHRHVVISHVDPSELASDRVSLRDTSFASTGGTMGGARKNHSLTFVIIGVLTVIAGGLVAFISTRHHESTAAASSATASFAPSQPTATLAPTATTPVAEREAVASQPTPSATATVKVKPHAATTTSAASAHPKEKTDRDIW